MQLQTNVCGCLFVILQLQTGAEIGLVKITKPPLLTAMFDLIVAGMVLHRPSLHSIR